MNNALDFDTEIDQLMREERQVNTLLQTCQASYWFGVTPTAVALLSATQLMSGTALESLQALVPVGPMVLHKDSAENHLALEAIMQETENKGTALSAKIIHLIKEGGEKIMATLTSVGAKIADIGSVLAQGTWDSAKAAGQVVKAHPYKTILLALGTCAAVAAAIAAGRPGDLANESALNSFIGKVADQIRKVKGPWWAIKVITTAAKGTEVLHCDILPVETELVSGSASSLGWNSSSVKAVLSQVGRLITTIKDALVVTGKAIWKVISFPSKIGAVAGDLAEAKTGSRIAKWVSRFVVSSAMSKVMYTLIKLVVKIVVKTVQKIFDVFNSLKSLVL